MSEGRTRYLFATGVDAAKADRGTLEARYAIVAAAFAEDKAMIEAQQKIWNATPPDRAKAFIPQDTGPAHFRRLVARRLAAETEAEKPMATAAE